ncbi:hypothetical protein [Marinobacterium sp. BA1]|uniref:hypothetical protein n=1 Tax=Marinobacterium sp. BA1 TaxID=3138931 RepID=UPI0032E5FFB5
MKTERHNIHKSIRFDRVRMEYALKSGPAIRIPQGLSREEMRQLIMRASTDKTTRK